MYVTENLEDTDITITVISGSSSIELTTGNVSNYILSNSRYSSIVIKDTMGAITGIEFKEI